MELMLRILLFVSCALSVRAGYEWAGVFELEAGLSYTWQLQQTDPEETGTVSWVDDTAKIYVVKTDHADEDGIHEHEDAALQLFEGTEKEYLHHEDDFEVGTLYEIHQGEETVETVECYLEVDEDGYYVIFFQHVPTEFEYTEHYFKQNGEDIEPLVEETFGGTSKYGEVFAACFIVSLTTFAGLVVTGPILTFCPCFNLDTYMQLGGAFASGTLLATAGFLMIPEAYLYSGIGPDNEVLSENVANAKFCSGLMGGYLCCALVHMLVNSTCGKPKTQDVAYTKEATADEAVGDQKVLAIDPEKESATVEKFEYVKKAGSKKCSEWTTLVWPILIGDGFHNVTDGIAIGAAFYGCGNSMGWTVMTGAVAHELTQEVSDYILLTTKGNMHWGMALLCNFLSGITCIIGGLISYAILDSGGSESGVGPMLAFGAGTYIWVAASEAFSKVVHDVNSLKATFLVMFFFIMGVLCIGLVLFGHEHCVSGDSHAGHNH